MSKIGQEKLEQIYKSNVNLCILKTPTAFLAAFTSNRNYMKVSTIYQNKCDKRTIANIATKTLTWKSSDKKTVLVFVYFLPFSCFLTMQDTLTDFAKLYFITVSQC